MNQWIDHFKQSSTGACIPEIDLAKPPLQAKQWQELRAAVKWQHTQFNLLVFTAAIVCLAFLLSAAVIAFSPEGLDRTRVGLLIACWMYLIVLTLFFERHAKKLPLKRFMGGAGEAGFSEIPAKDYPRVLVFIDGDHVAAQYVNSVLDQGRQLNRFEYDSLQDRFEAQLAERVVLNLHGDVRQRWHRLSQV